MSALTGVSQSVAVRRNGDVEAPVAELHRDDGVPGFVVGSFFSRVGHSFVSRMYCHAHATSQVRATRRPLPIQLWAHAAGSRIGKAA